MKTFNTYFSSNKDLESFLVQNNIKDSKLLLIQIFTSSSDEVYISDLTSFINLLLPNSSLIGSTTDGLIKDGFVTTSNTVISFTQFENTSLKVFISNSFKCSFEGGQNLALDLITDDTKVIISFVDGLSSNGEEFLDGISSINSDVKVSGGLASDNAKFEKTLVFTKDKIFKNAIVGVALDSKILNVFTDYSFNWLPIGVDLTITSCDKNRVFTINNKTAVDIYSYYLGNDIAKKLPTIGIEFPLIIKRDNISIARAVVAKEEDGSLIFAGNFKMEILYSLVMVTVVLF